jgi:hypothetical protein
MRDSRKSTPRPRQREVFPPERNAALRRLRARLAPCASAASEISSSSATRVVPEAGAVMDVFDS